jgi:bifunctional N-acetylglucosamine-1-phosphate-uridyltransferase/glucosamine-1-phosphate-acetyltransferase GlmU-like protein
MLKSAVVGYGRIVRDEEGNVIDIILPEEEEGAQVGQEQEDEEEEETGVKVVEAKTDVVRCEWLFLLAGSRRNAGVFGGTR